VLAGGTFPGPVIRGKKGDKFQLNVVNDLTDDTMEKSTSIVSLSMQPCSPEPISPEALAWYLAGGDELG
jgi:FtsP/CotA-like multicopper oxidase with cupredoxin domain